jgi:hypothetical protein
MRVFVVAACSAALSISVGANFPASAQQGQDPPGVNRTHFQCYQVKDRRDQRIVKRGDQFSDRSKSKRRWEQKIGKAILLCTPILEKEGRPYEDKETHLVCYETEPSNVTGKAEMLNQFGKSTLTLEGGVKMLCVPSKKEAVRELVLELDRPARR